METVKFRHILGRTALATLLSLAFVAATLPLAHAGQWYHGQWGHWGWSHGAHVFIVEPYPYAYYGPPPVVYAPPPPPVYYAPAPVVVGPSLGVVVHVH